MEQNTPDKRKVKIAIIVTICLIVAVILFVVLPNRSCSSSSKIEVVKEPQMTMEIGSLGYHPCVSATIKNKTNSTIKVQLSCSIYDREGNVTKNITSGGYISLASGETTTLVAQSFVDYSFAEYTAKCASFGNVEYKFL